MAKCNVKLKARHEIASGTMAFHFEKPEGFTFKPGQFGDFTLVEPPETDGEGNTRGFSFASAPYESDLMVATRMRDTAFKRVLKTMELGTEVLMDAPYGSLPLHGNASIPAVFLTGGIGITPVRSIILQAARDRLAHKITLFYSNRTPETSVFLEDLTRARQEDPNFTLINTMTETEGPDWSGETGSIDRALLAKSVPEFSLPIFYITGPREMVAAMRQTLEDVGVADDKIRTEEFSGY